MKRAEYLHRISAYASQFVLEIEGLNHSSLYDINNHAENFLIPVLNEIFQLSLKNVNTSHKKHFPAIDLADWDKRVAFQITATSSLKKIKETLRKFKESKLYASFDTLYIYIITHKKQKTRANITDSYFDEKFHFSIDEHVIDKDDMLQKISSIVEIQRIEKIAKIYEEEFSKNEIQLQRKDEIGKKDLAINFNPISNLPSNIEFYGRENDIATVTSAISKNIHEWGLLISGIAGIGKTSLALFVANKAFFKKSFEAFIFITAKKTTLEPGGILQNYKSVSIEDDFINETVRVLGKPNIIQMNESDKRNAFFELLKEVPTLIIYDNLESLSSVGQDSIARFLIGLPKTSKAILTSRRQGAVGGRHLSLNDLDWAAAKAIILSESEKDSVLRSKIYRHKSRWKELYTETFGSPLAIKHMLGLIRVRHSLSFDGALRLLKSKSGIDERISYMFQEARLELMHNDKLVLAAITYFDNYVGINPICEVAGLSLELVKESIDRIGRICLLDLKDSDDQFKVHPLTREFVEKEILEFEEYQKVGLRFAKYWVSFAEKYGGDSNNSYKTFNLLEKEWTNIDSAINLLARFSDNKKFELHKEVCFLLDRLVEYIRQFLLYSGRWDERISFNKLCYQLMKTMGNKQNQGWRAYDISFTFINQGNLTQAKSWIDRAVKAWAINGFKLEEAEAIRILGIISDRNGEFNNAIVYYENALTLFDELKDKKNKAIVLSDLGITFSKIGKFNKAEKCYLDAIHETPRVSDKAFYWRMLGDLKLGQNNFIEAEKCYVTALALGKKSRIRQVKAGAYVGLAVIEESRHNYSKALRLAKIALKIREELRHVELKKTRDLVCRLEIYRHQRN